MPMPIPSITAYLSRRTNSAGLLVWTAIVRNSPLCADTTEPQNAIDLLRQVIGKAPVWVWNGDRGEFENEPI